MRRFRHEKYKLQFIKSRVQAGGGSKVYSGRMDQHLYLDTQENELKPSVELLIPENQDWIFQQDNATKQHCST